MRTKLEAAEIAMNCGGAAVIANGDIPDILGQHFRGRKLSAQFFCRPDECAESVAGSRMRRACAGALWWMQARTGRSRRERQACSHRAWCASKVRLRRWTWSASWTATGASSRAASRIAPASRRKSFPEENVRIGSGRRGAGSLVLFTRDNIVLMQK